MITSVKTQKDESQNGCYKKTEHTKFSEKKHFLPPDQGLKNVPFSENVKYFVFFKQPFWESPFCLITDELYTHVNS